MSDARVIYRPRPDATPETEVAALAAVYRFVLDCQTRKKDSAPPNTTDGTKEIKDAPPTISIQK